MSNLARWVVVEKGPPERIVYVTQHKDDYGAFKEACREARKLGCRHTAVREDEVREA